MELTLAANVAAEVRAEFARRQIQYSALAVYMGRTPNTITRILNSQQPINLQQLEQIARFLDIDPVILIGRAVAA